MAAPTPVNPRRYPRRPAARNRPAPPASRPVTNPIPPAKRRLRPVSGPKLASAATSPRSTARATKPSPAPGGRRRTRRPPLRGGAGDAAKRAPGPPPGPAPAGPRRRWVGGPRWAEARVAAAVERRVEGEQDGVRGAQVQHGGGPLQAPRRRQAHRLARGADGGVHRQGPRPGRGRRCGRTATAARSVIGVLHRHHRRQPHPHQGGGRAGEDVPAAAPGPLAGVEHRQAQRVVVGAAAAPGPWRSGGTSRRRPRRPGRGSPSPACGGSKPPWPTKWKTCQGPPGRSASCRAPPGLPLQPDQLHQAPRPQVAPGPAPSARRSRPASSAGRSRGLATMPRIAQRRGRRPGARRAPAARGGAPRACRWRQADVVAPARGRRGTPRAAAASAGSRTRRRRRSPLPCSRAICRLDVVAGAGLAGQQGLEQGPRRSPRPSAPPGPPARPHVAAQPGPAQERVLQRQQAVLQRQLVEGEAQRRPRLAPPGERTATGYSRPAPDADLDLEVEVAPGARPPALAAHLPAARRPPRAAAGLRAVPVVQDTAPRRSSTRQAAECPAPPRTQRQRRRPFAAADRRITPPPGASAPGPRRRPSVR